VFVGELSASATASGQVTARQEASLSVDTPGEVVDVLVRVGAEVAAGDVLVQIDTTNLEMSVSNAELSLRLEEANLADLLAAPYAADIASAEASVASAQASLDDLLDGPSAEEIELSDISVRSSQASVASAAANLGTAQESVTESQILSAQAALLSAQLQLENAQDANDDLADENTHAALLEAQQAVADAQANLDDLLDGPDTTSAQGSLNSAAANLDGSQANYNITLSGATNAQIASAQSQLAQAQSTLADLVGGPTAEELAIAEAGVAQAQLSLQDAQDALAAATIVAPFDGVVTAVYVSPGEYASGIVVELVNTNSLQVVLEVDEVDVGDLSVGQPATVTLETWPDVEIASEIVTIAPSAQTASDSTLIVYAVYLSLGETDLPVRVGMTADANLITAQYSDTLLVPNRAINADREKGTYSVHLIVGEEIQDVAVTIGARDSENTQITSGLNAGDEIMVGDYTPLDSITPGPGGNDDGGSRFGG
jgi:HlyD family secretion protein